MNLAIWNSWYKVILDEFGFSRSDDEKSAELLNNILEDTDGLSTDDLDIKRDVIVFGAGPSLKRNIIEIKELELHNFTLIAADGATTGLMEEGLVPEVIVTDLDGKIEDIMEANREGAFLVVHAHGNNLPKIKEYVPQLKRVMGTTQSTPLGKVYNFGGFTDGDRCLFLAVELGARRIVLAGMDFGSMVTKYSRPDLEEIGGEADAIKKLKLEFARELIEWIVKNEKVQIFNISGGEKMAGVRDVTPGFIKNHL